MIFSSVIFLFFFLPCVWAVYYLSWKKAHDFALLLASLVFYAWGGREQVLVLLFSILVNYLVGLSFLIVDRVAVERRTRLNPGSATPSQASVSSPRKLLFILGITSNLALLTGYKYLNFLVANLNLSLGWLDFGPIALDQVVAPLGISFFTFHALSYLVETYQFKAAPQRNPLKFALYLAVFPKVLAGPILRYHDAENQLTERRITSRAFSIGIERFIIGLGKEGAHRQSPGCRGRQDLCDTRGRAGL